MKELHQNIREYAFVSDCMSLSTHDAKMIEIIKQNYRFTAEDENNLRSLEELMTKNADRFLNELYAFIGEFEHAKAFITTDNFEIHFRKMKQWFLSLFTGPYDDTFFARLNCISKTHSRVGLPTHYTNASFNFVRRFLVKRLAENDRLGALDSVGKIIDINLDVLTSAHVHHDTKRTVEVVTRIKRALDSSSVIPFYQPIVANDSGEIVKHESLVRILEGNTVVPPVDFLPVAKRVELYPEISREVIGRAFADHKDGQQPFSLNISIDDILNRETNGLIFALLEDSGIGPYVTFEILESEKIDDYSVLTAFIKEVKQFGAKIAIDDFGTGFSNFNYILNMDIDYLKIDGSLIKNLHESRESQTTVEAIVGLADKLGIETIAEFVSSEEVFQAVKKAGVTYSQGYWFGKPEQYQLTGRETRVAA